MKMVIDAAGWHRFEEIVALMTVIDHWRLHKGSTATQSLDL